MVRCSRHARESNMHGTVPSEARPDVFRSITAKIVAAIEAGAGAATMPWHGGILPPTFPMNAATDKAYRGVNVVALWVDAMSKRYISGYWASYKQWQTLGAQVRKGERGSIIVFNKPLDQPELGVQDAAPGEVQRDRDSHMAPVERRDLGLGVFINFMDMNKIHHCYYNHSPSGQLPPSSNMSTRNWPQRSCQLQGVENGCYSM